MIAQTGGHFPKDFVLFNPLKQPLVNLLLGSNSVPNLPINTLSWSGTGWSTLPTAPAGNAYCRHGMGVGKLLHHRHLSKHTQGPRLTPPCCLHSPLATGAVEVCVSVSEAECWQAGKLGVHLVTYINCGTYFLHRALVTVWRQKSVLSFLGAVLSGDLKPPHRQTFYFRNGFGKLLPAKYQKVTSKQMVGNSENTLKGISSFFLVFFQSSFSQVTESVFISLPPN